MHYKYAYDEDGNIVRSIDIRAKKEYNYTYEDGRLMRAVESNVTLSDIGNVTSKTVLNTIIYSYDSEGKLAKKRIIPGHKGTVLMC